MDNRTQQAINAVKAARMDEAHKAAYIARLQAGDPHAMFSALFLAKRQAGK